MHRSSRRPAPWDSAKLHRAPAGGGWAAYPGLQAELDAYYAYLYGLTRDGNLVQILKEQNVNCWLSRALTVPAIMMRMTTNLCINWILSQHGK